MTVRPTPRGLRPRLLALALIVAASSGSAATPLADAARRLDGRWDGYDGFVLRIDSRRAQASIDPARPFEWQRFLVREADGRSVVFTVGAELFEATLEAGALKLTGTSFRGERLLYRDTLRGGQP